MKTIETFDIDNGQIVQLWAAGTSPPNTAYFNSGEYVISHTVTSNVVSLHYYVNRPLYEPNVYTSIKVVSTPITAHIYDAYSVGIYDSIGGWAFIADYRRHLNTCSIYTNMGAAGWKSPVIYSMTPPYEIVFTLIGNVATMYELIGGSLNYLTHYNITEYDFTVPNAMSGWYCTILRSTEPQATCRMDDFTIDSPAPEIAASVSCTFVNKKVNFECNMSGTIYNWNFGDGATSIKCNPFHIYTKAGTYFVTLTIDNILANTISIVVFESSFILDAGAVYLNYGEKNQMLLGATEGGNQFGIDQDFRHMTFDTINNSELAGSHRLINSVPKIIANFIEINYRLLSIVTPDSNITFKSGAIMINRAIKKLLNNDYVKNIAIVAAHGGTGCYIVFRILNAITVENLEIPFEDSNESVIEVTFAGCFSENNYDNEPWQIDIITKS